MGAKWVTALGCILVLLGVAYMWTVPRAPNLVEVAADATLLHYSSPAAVHTDQGTAVGYVTNNGVVEVAAVGSDGRLISRTKIHQYETPDDHAAPALWPIDGGLLVATAHHSSDMFLYRLGNAGEVTEICHWFGRFTYPRFVNVDGRLRLYARLEDLSSGIIGSGNIGYFSPDSQCLPARLQFVAPPDDWIYAPLPFKGHVAWAHYNQISRKNTGLWIDGHLTPLSMQPRYDQDLPWSISGNLVAVTRFNDMSMVMEIYDGQKRIFESSQQALSSFPSGIVLSQDGTEGLFPDRDTLVRRDIGGGFTGKPSCSTGTPALFGQYVKGGAGSYVLTRPIKKHNSHRLLGKVYLCLTPAIPGSPL